MGISSLSDMMTGRNFRPNEEVVVLVISRRQGGYPDASFAAAMPPIYPTSLFEVQSLPIRCLAGMYGDILPLADQIAVDLLVRDYGCDDWEGFADKALDWQGEGIARVAPEIFKEPNSLLGVCAFSASTWDFLSKWGGNQPDKNEAVSVVSDAMADTRRRPGQDAIWGAGSAVTFLRFADRSYTTSDGRSLDMPMLARALTELEGPATLGQSINAQATALIRQGAAEDTTAGFEDVLGGLYELQAALYSLHRLNKAVLPSTNGGQSKNADHIIKSMGNFVSEALDLDACSLAEDDDFEAPDRIAATIAMLEQLTEKAKRLAANLDSEMAARL